MTEDIRTCGQCQATVNRGLPDPCIGTIRGASYACCGHDDGDCYVAKHDREGWEETMAHFIEQVMLKLVPGHYFFIEVAPKRAFGEHFQNERALHVRREGAEARDTIHRARKGLLSVKGVTIIRLMGGE